ncbi:MAG: DUF3147 family protein [Verrucomicrobiota bacterium]
MGFLILKYAVTAFIIVLVTEVAKKTDRVGALISSLPLVTVMVMIWLYAEKQGTEKIALHATYTFWYVLPTMPMFLLIPHLLGRGLGFWLALSAGCLLTVVLFVLTAYVAKLFQVEMW